MNVQHKCHYAPCSNLTKNPKFCSLSCGVKQQHVDAPPAQRIQRICVREDCDNEFSVPKPSDKKRYCSQSCAARVNNVIVPKRKSEQVTRGCLHCSQGFSVPPNSTRKFCSSECSGAFKRKAKVESWLKGEWDGGAKAGLSRTIRNHLLEQANYRCQSPTCCVEGGWGEVNPLTQRSPLEIDHIDGDAYNNVPSNLIVLCPNCHSLTSTYRALNRTGSRKYREDYRYPKYLSLTQQ